MGSRLKPTDSLLSLQLVDCDLELQRGWVPQAHEPEREADVEIEAAIRSDISRMFPILRTRLAMTANCDNLWFGF